MKPSSSTGSLGRELSPDDHVLSHRLDDKHVLVNVDNGEIFQLTGTAKRIWELIEQRCTFATLLERLHAEFEADAATLEAEARVFVQELVDAGLLIARPS
jgi:hypothetical protein